MAELKEYLSNIAEAIRTKKGTTEKINAQDFASEIITIESSINPVEILTEQEMLAETKAENLGAVFKYVGATGAYTQGEYYKVVQVEAVHIPYLGYPYYVIMYEPLNNGFRIVWRATPDLYTYGDSWYNDGFISGGSSRYNYYVKISGSRYISSIYSTLAEAVTAIQSADTTYTYTEDSSTYIYKNGGTAIYNDTLVFYSNFSGEITYSDGDDITTFTENPLLTDSYSTIRIYSPIFETKTVKPTTQNQSIYPSANYDGLSQVDVEAITTEEKTIEPSTSSQTITPTSGSYISKVTVNPVTSSIDSDIKAENIKSGVDILGVTGSLETGITPSGTISITNNGTYNVTNYASAEVSVEAQSSGLSINGVIEQYKVEAGETVNAGDFVEFILNTQASEISSAATSKITAKLMSTNLVAVLFYTNSRWAINVLEFEDGSVTLKTTYAITATVAAIETYSDNTLFLAYGKSSDGVYSTLLSFTGDSLVELTEPTSLANAYTFYQMYCDKIADNKIVMSFIDNASTSYTWNPYVIKKVTATIDNQTISCSSIGVIKASSVSKSPSGTSYYYRVSDTFHSQKINNGVVIAYTYYDDGTNYVHFHVIRCQDGTVSSTTNTLSLGGLYDSVVCPIGTDKILIATESRVYVYEVSGTALSQLTSISVSSSIVQSTKSQLINVDDNKFVLCTGATFNVYSFDGSAITLIHTATVPFLGTNTTQCVLPTSSTNGLIFRVGATGAFNSYTITDDGVTFYENENGQNGTTVKKATSRLYNVGIANTGGVGGETIDVYRVP